MVASAPPPLCDYSIPAGFFTTGGMIGHTFGFAWRYEARAESDRTASLCSTHARHTWLMPVGLRS